MKESGDSQDFSYEAKKHSQFLQLLAKLPGVWADDADSILADPKNTQHAQPIQPTFVDLC